MCTGIVTQIIVPMTPKFGQYKNKFFTVTNNSALYKKMFRHEWLYRISRNILRLSCSYSKWLALAKLGIHIHLHIVTYQSTSSINRSSSLLDFGHVFIFFWSKESSQGGLPFLSKAAWMSPSPATKTDSRARRSMQSRGQQFRINEILSLLETIFTHLPIGSHDWEVGQWPTMMNI